MAGITCVDATCSTFCDQDPVHFLPVRAGTEQRCGDRSCSIGGVCLNTTLPASHRVNSSPEIELLPVPAADASGVVRVPRGWLYEFCSPGVAGTVQEPCEPGAHA